MKIRKLMPLDRGWCKFDLNVGGFTIKNCRWKKETRQVLFPWRYDGNYRTQVVYAHGALVKRLQQLLESGQTALPRDRRPCILRVQLVKWTTQNPEWLIFNFWVRGFKIQGCRWHPSSGSIQLPVTFIFEQHGRQRHCCAKKQIVCAYGVHINRLRKALEKEFVGPDENQAQEEVQEHTVAEPV